MRLSVVVVGEGGRDCLALYGGAMGCQGVVQGGQGFLRQCGDGLARIAGVIHVAQPDRVLVDAGNGTREGRVL